MEVLIWKYMQHISNTEVWNCLHISFFYINKVASTLQQKKKNPHIKEKNGFVKFLIFQLKTTKISSLHSH